MALPIVALPTLVSAFAAQMVVILGVVGFKLVLKVLVLLGFGTVSITGFDFVLGGLIDLMTANMSGLPSQVMSLLSILKFDKAVTIIISSYVVAAGFRGVNSITKPFMSGGSQ